MGQLSNYGSILLILITDCLLLWFPSPSPSPLFFRKVDNTAEIDGQGSEVGKTGTKKHVLNSLASQQFTFSKVDNVSYYQGIDVITSVNLSVFLSGPQATLDTMVLLFLQEGNVTFDAAPEDLLEANGVEKDGITRNKEEAVNDNLPTAFHIDHKKLFIFRIPRFNNTVLIDPAANIDGVAGKPITSGGDSSNGGGGVESSMKPEEGRNNDPTTNMDGVAGEPITSGGDSGNGGGGVESSMKPDEEKNNDPTDNMDGVAGEPITSGVWHLKGTCHRMTEEETMEKVKRVGAAHSGGKKRNRSRGTRRGGCR
ncbi:unnamed protein product [Porites evermanni]|uniref:Uncharacterized protein n=1 Tax=Porites evermanni TaxID=104178 RepID=A0ABN8Q8I8_9CNID|nr:unnamed protein product [Porites evermanni]